MELEGKRILVVDDEPAISLVIQDYLTMRKLDVRTAGNFEEALRHLGATEFDVVLSDIRMPGRSGTDLLRHIRRHHPQVAVVLFTGYADIGLAVQSMQEGAYDFILKPIQLEQVYLSIYNAVERRSLKDEVRRYQRGLEELVEQRTQELVQAVASVESAYHDTVTRLSRAAELRDDETGNHVLRIRAYSVAISRALALPSRDCDLIFAASPMHDIGKIGIPDAILLKPGRLTIEEFEVMKRHALIGANVLRDSESPILHMAEIIARSHHEKWDGSGYPFGIAGEEIPIPGRIVAIADVYDALTTRRCYKPAFSFEKSREIILQSRGTHFDPVVVDAFAAIGEEFRAIMDEFSEMQHKKEPASELASASN